MDTGAGFKLIRMDFLPYGWEQDIDGTSCEHRLNDENGRPRELSEIVWLKIRFGNKLYQVRHIISEKLAVDAIIGTYFMNKHMSEILCK